MFLAGLTNYLGLGCKRNYYSDGSFSLSIIPCKLGKYDVWIEQNREFIANSANAGGIIKTSLLKISGVKTFLEGERIANDVSCLLSLASMSQVRPYSYKFKDDEKIIPVFGEAMSFRPLMEISNGETIKKFIESTWPTYRKLKRSRKLSELIDMLTTCELPKLALEIQLGQMFILH